MTTSARTVAVVAIAAFVLMNDGALANNATARGTVAYRGATLIDGNGGKPIADAVIIVRGGKIAAAGPAAITSVPADADVVDVAHRWITPGLIDAHVHFFESGKHDAKYAGGGGATATAQYAEQVAWMKHRAPYTLQRYLCAGVTSAISLGGPSFELAMKHLAGQHPAAAPTVYVATGPITTVSSQALFRDFDGSPPLLTATSATVAARDVTRGARSGSDLVKVGYLAEPGLMETDPLPIIRAAATVAHAIHQQVDLHLLKAELVDTSIDAGVDILAHAPGGDLAPATLQHLRDRQIVVTSTLLIWKRASAGRSPAELIDEAERQCGDPEVISSWEVPKPDPTAADLGNPVMLRAVQDNLRKLRAAGISVAVGTDAGNEGLLHGASMHAELEALAEIGFTPSELIVAATRNAARVVGKEATVGTISAGRAADFLVLTEDPLVDIRNLAKIETVVHLGHAIPRSQLLATAEP